MKTEKLERGAISENTSAKLLGRYYTPLPIAQIMTNWAVTKRDARIFDPSFGGCSFFEAGLGTLQRLGTRVPGRHLYGVDVDPSARRYLNSALKAGGGTGHFLTQDFLDTRPSDFDGGFDCVVGNPPYVRHHSLASKPASRFNVAGQEVILPKSSNYWAYFVLHALNFVSDSGRLAFVLPSSFLFADYGNTVRSALIRRFGCIYMISVGEHLFHDAEEASVLLLATGRPSGAPCVRTCFVKRAEDLEPVVRNLDLHTIPIAPGRDELLRSLINPETVAAFERVRRRKGVVSLGDIATIRIGVVTGFNEFFLLTQHQAAALRLGTDQCIPAVARQSNFNGSRLTQEDLIRLSNAGEPVWLLSLDKDSEDFLSSPLEAYLSVGERAGIDKTRKCSERDVWQCLGDSPIPDAFLPCMLFNNAHLVYNAAGATSTNTIHHVFWNGHLNRQRASSIVTSSLSTLFGLSAEFYGRRYAGGLLKLEPSDAARLLCLDVPFPLSVVKKAEQLTRDGKWSEARELVDHYALVRGLGVSERELGAMRSALINLQQTRAVKRRRDRAYRRTGLM